MKGLFPRGKTIDASLEEHPFLGSPLPRFSNTKHDILDFSCCPLSRILQKFRFEFHLRSSPFAFRGYGWSVDQLITSLLATPCWWDPTRSKQLSTVAILGFQFGLHHVVVPLSFLRSNQPYITVAFLKLLRLRSKSVTCKIIAFKQKEFVFSEILNIPMLKIWLVSKYFPPCSASFFKLFVHSLRALCSRLDYVIRQLQLSRKKNR